MATKKQSFASAYEELQQITKEFEAESIDLEASIPKFRRAAELVKFLKQRLSEIETEIETIDLDSEASLADTQILENTTDDVVDQ